MSKARQAAAVHPVMVGSFWVGSLLTIYAIALVMRSTAADFRRGAELLHDTAEITRQNQKEQNNLADRLGLPVEP